MALILNIQGMKTKQEIIELFKPYCIDGEYILNQGNLERLVGLIIKSPTISSDVEEVYKSYPTSCVVSGRPSGKTKKNKDKIRQLLKSDYAKEELITIINKYVKLCKQHDTYMKNFSTFLNNIPDYGNLEKPEHFVEYDGMVHANEGFDSNGLPTHSEFILARLFKMKYSEKLQTKS